MKITIDVDLTKATNGEIRGVLSIRAEVWTKRHSWGHIAYAGWETNMGRGDITETIRYYNRTWESYQFQSIFRLIVRGVVMELMGVDVWKLLGKRDTTPKKGAEAEKRRLARVETYNKACRCFEMIMHTIDRRG